jgi:hypothetical protein
MQGQPPGSGNVRESYKLDKLTPDDILHQIYCLCQWFLYLTKDEHLRKNSLGKTRVCLWVRVRTIWEISCWYLYSFFFSPTSVEEEVVFLAGVIICGLNATQVLPM